MTPEGKYMRNPCLLEAYQKITAGQINDHFVKLSSEECKHLVGLISTLEEENRRLLLQATQVSKDLQAMYGSDGD